MQGTARKGDVDLEDDGYVYGEDWTEDWKAVSLTTRLSIPT